MTKAMGEARAIASAAAGQVHDNADARCVEALVEQLAVTALAARDAEIERLREALERVADAVTTRSLRGRDHTPSMREEQDAVGSARAALSAASALTAGEREPVARANVTQEDDGLYAELEVLNGERMQAVDSPVNLYLDPPPTSELEAENARLQRERDDFKDEWQAELEKRMEVQARLRATEARLAEALKSVDEAYRIIGKLEAHAINDIMYDGRDVAAWCADYAARRVREGGKVE
jgi:chromosome segregation ATPase